MKRLAALCCLTALAAADPATPGETEILFLVLEKPPSAEEAVRAAAALTALPGVSMAEVSGVEAIVTTRKGGETVGKLLQALKGKGLAASAQGTDTWRLMPETVVELEPAQRLKASLAGSGVTAVSAGADGSLSVSAHVPHMTTPKLLALLAAAGIRARIPQEDLTVRIRCRTEEQEQARRKLASVPGVLKVEIAESTTGDFRVTREKGRAPAERLSEAISGTGWELEVPGS